MNERDLHDTLHDLGAPAASDVDVWPAVRSRLRAAQTPVPRWRLHGYARLAGVLALVLVLGMVTTAVMQGIIDLDPGLEGERALELVTPLDISQTDNDITVALNWAYADGNRLVLNYTLTGWSLPLGGPNTSLPNIRDESRHALRALNLVWNDDSVPDSVSQTVLYDTRTITGEPEALALSAFFQLGRTSFTVPFTVPFRPARLVAEPMTVTANGITMTLEGFRVTDTMTTFELCYDTPSPDNWWLSLRRVLFDGVRADGLSGSEYTSGLHVRDDGQTCYEGGLFTPVDVLPEEIRLEVPALRTPFHWTEENLSVLVEEWAAHGIRAEIRPSGDSVTLSYPDGFPEDMAPEEHDAILEAALARMPDGGGSERVDGPWVFVLTP